MSRKKHSGHQFNDIPEGDFGYGFGARVFYGCEWIEILQHGEVVNSLNRGQAVKFLTWLHEALRESDE